MTAPISFSKDGPTIAALHLYPEGMEDITDGLTGIYARIRQQDYPCPAMVRIGFKNTNQVWGCTTIALSSDGKVLGPEIDISYGALQADKRILKAVLAHEYAHILDFARIAKKHGHSVDLNDQAAYDMGRRMSRIPTESTERRVIRLSCELADNPWDVAAMHVLGANEHLNAAKAAHESADKWRTWRLKRTIAHGDLLLEALPRAGHPSLRNTIKIIEQYCHAHHIEKDEAVLAEVRDLDRQARQRW